MGPGSESLKSAILGNHHVMAKKERFHIPGTLYHVILRDTFSDNKDRFRFYDILDHASATSPPNPTRLGVLKFTTDHQEIDYRLAPRRR